MSDETETDREYIYVPEYGRFYRESGLWFCHGTVRVGQASAQGVSYWIAEIAGTKVRVTGGTIESLSHTLDSLMRQAEVTVEKVGGASDLLEVAKRKRETMKVYGVATPVKPDPENS